jgi:hypothetical protein
MSSTAMMTAMVIYKENTIEVVSTVKASNFGPDVNSELSFSEGSLSSTCVLRKNE